MSFQVMSKQCETCIFSSASPISPERLEQLKAIWAAENRSQECHVATIANERVACRGHFNRWLYGDMPYPLDGIKDSLGFASSTKADFVQIARRLGWITEVEMSKA